MTLYAFLNFIMLILVGGALGVLVWAVRSHQFYRKMQNTGDPSLIEFMLMMSKAFLFRSVIIFMSIGLLVAVFITPVGAT